MFDMQLDEGGEVPRGELDARQLALEPGGAADLVEREALRVAQRRHRLGREGPGERPAAQAADAEPGRLLAGENQELDRPHRLEPGISQGADRRQSAEHSDRAVEPAGVRDRVDVRASPDRSQLGPESFPARERVADRVFADRQARHRRTSSLM